MSDRITSLLARLHKQRFALQIGEPCANWEDAVEAADEIIRLRVVLEEFKDKTAKLVAQHEATLARLKKIREMAL